MASPSSAFSSTSSSSFFIFFMCFSMHAFISSNARDIRVTNVNAGSLKDCEQYGASIFVARHEHGSPCRMIIARVEIGALFGSEAKEEEHATTKSERSRKVVGYSSSRMNFMEATNTDQVSGGSSTAGGHGEFVVSENNINSDEDIIDMDYHTPHRNSPIHNK